MRLALLDCCYFDWSNISPAIFGSMFQGVMNPKERRNLGAHYTSETNILKLIKPLFLDELWREFETIQDNRNKLLEFHKRLSKMKFLDPACGCGNFLVITYRELRLLEIAILRALNKTGQQVMDVREIIMLDVDIVYGIEYEEFPAKIAETAMWLIDHQMNMKVSYEFGQYFIRLPLNKAATIVHGNALQIDWESIVSKSELTYILGNPPFVGSRLMSKTQKNDLIKVFDNSKNIGELDYVSAWYMKATKYIQDTKIKVAFVSTNSIVQGEQPAILWGQLLNKYNIKIHFAHRTFKWSNEGRGVAAVYCVIIGFASYDTPNKTIYEYKDIKGEAHGIPAQNINPYLVDAKDIVIYKRNAPICKVPEIVFGNMPNDGGYLLFSNDEKNEFLQKEPKAEKYMKQMLSAYEFLNGEKRWCLWLLNSEPNELKQMPEVLKRVELVKEYRLKSTREATRKLAQFPTLFGEIRQPSGKYILIPRVSSEKRPYIPMGFFDDAIIVSDTCLSVNSTASLFHFGILQSNMHMAWVKSVCGRLENRFRYSNEIVYNNYPWPENPTEKHIKAIEKAAQKVLDTRDKFPNSSLADLYDPLTMPPALVKAHNELDKAVDLAYRPQPFTSEANRMEFLFSLYEKYTKDLFTKERKPKKRKKNA
jgi:hypothetical protein